jgi:hypothetical protein
MAEMERELHEGMENMEMRNTDAPSNDSPEAT